MAWAFAGGPAAAAPTQFAIRIGDEPLAQALVDFAIQTKSSIDTSHVSACAPVRRSLAGRLSREAALKQLLAGSGCSYRMVDVAGFVITVLPALRPQRAPITTFAQPVSTLAQVLVTAVPRSTPADGHASSLSVVDPRALAANGATSDADIALLSPAMTVTNLGSGRDKILLRGLSDGPLTGQAQSMVGLYLDDLRLTYNAPDPDLRLVDVARVTVLRGPQGALYGAGSMGGVVHIATAPPDPAAFGGWIAASVGTTEGGGPSQSLDAVINAPLFDHRGGVRVVLYNEIVGGFIDDLLLGVPRANRTVRQGGRAAFTAPLNESWTLTAGLASQAINSADTQYTFAGEPAYARTNHVREPHDNDFGEYHVGLLGHAGWGDVRWSTGVIRHSLTSRYDATAAPPPGIGPAGTSSL